MMTSHLFIRCTAHPHLSCSISLPFTDGDKSILCTDATVRDLKSRIATTLHVNTEGFPFTLCYNYSFLVDETKKLEEIGVKDGSIVDLVPSDVLSMLFPTDPCRDIYGSIASTTKEQGPINAATNGTVIQESKNESSKDLQPYIHTPLNSYQFLPHYHTKPPHDTPDHHPHNDTHDERTTSRAGKGGLVVTVTWPQILVLSIVPNIMIAGSIFFAIQFMKEFKTFEQLSQEGGDAMAQGFLDTLAKDDYKICKEIVKKMLVGWVEEVNNWRRGWIPPYQLPMVPNGSTSSTSSSSALGSKISNWTDYGNLFDSLKSPSSGSK